MTRALHDILRARAFACTRMDVVHTQGNPFIGAKRKRVPAVIRQTGCIIDRGIEFSLCPCPIVRFASSSSSSASLSVSYLTLCTPSPAVIARALTYSRVHIEMLSLSLARLVSPPPFFLSLSISLLPLRTSH